VRVIGHQRENHIPDVGRKVNSMVSESGGFCGPDSRAIRLGILNREIAKLLEEARSLLQEPEKYKITLVARHVETQEKSLLVSDDEMVDLVRAVGYLRNREIEADTAVPV